MPGFIRFTMQFYIRRPLCLLFLGMLAVCALWFAIFGIKGTDPLLAYEKQTLTFSGRVTRKEVKRDGTGETQVVWYLVPDDLRQLVIQVYPAKGTDAFPRTADTDAPAIGMRVTVRGKLRCFQPATNPGEFDARLYYRTLGIDCRLTDAVILETQGRPDAYRETLFLLQRFFAHVIDRCADEEDAGMLKAMLLGDRSSLDADIKRMYREASLGHLYATSGLHCAVTGMLLFRMLLRLRLPRAASSALCILLMISYGFLCGMPLSAVRAVCMFSLSLIAPLIGRTYDLLSACALSGIMMLAEQPLYVCSSGFLLSFGAIMGIGYLLPLLEEVFLPRSDKCGLPARFAGGHAAKRGLLLRFAGRFCRGILASLSVTLATLPVYMCCYYTFPVYSVFLNAFAIPLMAFLMPCGIMMLAAGSVAELLLRAGISAAAGLSGISAAAGLSGSFAATGPSGFSQIAGRLLLRAAHLLSLPCHAILWFYRTLCTASGALPSRTWYAGCASPWQVAAYYLLLVLFVRTALRVKNNRLCSGTAHGHGKLPHRAGVKRPFADVPRRSGVKRSPAGIRHFAGLLRRHTGSASGACACLVCAVAVLSFRMPPALQITILDVGQGDGIVVRSASCNYLIDCGSTSKSSVGEYQLIPFLKHAGIGFLDGVFISHEDEDHVSGVLELLDDMAHGGIRTGRLFLPDTGREGEMTALAGPGGTGGGGSMAVDAGTVTVEAGNEDGGAGSMSGEVRNKTGDRCQELVLYAGRLGVPVTYLSAGQQVTQGDLVFTCLAPVRDGIAASAAGANAHSMVLHLQYQPEVQPREARTTQPRQTTQPHINWQTEAAVFSALFTGDVEAEGLGELNDTLSALPAPMRQVDLLKVAHHGSRHTTNERFLSLVDARLSVISCGKNNRYGHPHAELLDRLEADGTQILTTPACGAITVYTGRSGRVYAKLFSPAAETVP